MAAIIMPQAASLDRTQAIAERVDAIFARHSGVEKRTMITGYSLLDGGFKTNAGDVLRHVQGLRRALRVDRHGEGAERARDSHALLQAKRSRSRARLSSRSRRRRSPASARPAVSSSGSRTPAPATRSRSTTSRRKFSPRRGAARADRARDDLRANTQQLRADVDRDKTTLLGIPIQDVYSAIQAQFGSLTVSQYNQFSRVWWVILQSDAQFRQTPGDLTRLYTRNEPTTRWCRCRRS